MDVAADLKIHEGTLSNWVRQYRDVHPVDEKPLTVSERARLVELEKEVRELRMKTEFLGKAAAYAGDRRQGPGTPEAVPGRRVAL